MKTPTMSWKVVRPGLIWIWLVVGALDSVAQIPGLPSAYPAVTSFSLGSMGGYYTVQQSLDKIDSLIAQYPNLLSSRISLGNSFNGRSVWYVRMSDHPTLDEDEPEILYTAVMHSNEPLSMMQLFYFMSYLLQNYGVNPHITHLLDTREIYFVPVMNPDGLFSNSVRNPNGGGTLRRTGQRYFDVYDRMYETGMDINRSFLEHWTGPRVSVRADWASDYFQGNYPYESWEAAYLKAFCNQRHFNIAVNAHDEGRLLVLPWNWSAFQLCPDSVTYKYYADQMTRINQFDHGLAYQLDFESHDSRDGFASRGTVDDWMYADTTEKNRIVAMSLVVGTRKWLPADSIIYFSDETISSNLFALWAAGPFVQVTNHHVLDPLDQDTYVNAGQSGQLIVAIQNSGQVPVSSIHLSTGVTDTNIVLQNTDHDFPGLGVFQKDSNTLNPITFLVRPSAKTGDIVHFVLNLTFDGHNIQDTVEFIVGTPSILFADAGESRVQWDTSDTQWGLFTATAGAGPGFTDSPIGPYMNYADNALLMASNIDLSNVVRPWLQFSTKWDIEKFWDFGTVELSTDNGLTWINLQPRNSVRASGKPGPQADKSTYGFDGTKADWVDEYIDLRRWQGAGQAKIRFRLQADGWIVYDGWYVDEIILRGFVRPPLGFPEPGPHEFELMPNAPNPFNPSTQIRFLLRVSSPVTIEIFNVLGQRVRRLSHDVRFPPGMHSTQWNGDNDQGRMVSSGVYICRLRTSFGTESRKMILIK